MALRSITILSYIDIHYFQIHVSINAMFYAFHDVTMATINVAICAGQMPFCDKMLEMFV